MEKSLILEKILLGVAGVLKIEHGKNHAVRCEKIFDKISVLHLESNVSETKQEILF